MCHSALVGGDADQVDASPELAHVQRFGLFTIRGYELSLRKAEAMLVNIEVEDAK